jgi:hypothetical protein
MAPFAYGHAPPLVADVVIVQYVVLCRVAGVGTALPNKFASTKCVSRCLSSHVVGHAAETGADQEPTHDTPHGWVLEHIDVEVCPSEKGHEVPLPLAWRVT